MIRKISLLLPLILVCLLVTSCEDKLPEPTADRKAQAKTESTMREAASQVGFPAIVNFQELKLAKMIYELRDQEKLICHAYLFNQYTGRIGQYLGKCIGFGLPYSVQFSNPEKIVVNKTWSSGGSLYGTLPQPEPNGLFMPDGLSATWLILINPVDGEPYPVYIEPQIIVSPFPLHKTD